MDTAPLSAEALYPAYKLAESALLALDKDDTESEQGKKICSEYLKIGGAYASTPFGIAKLSQLHTKLHTASWRIREETLRKDDLFDKGTFSGFWDKEGNISSVVTTAMSTGESNLIRKGERNAGQVSPILEIHAPKEIKTALERQGLNVGDFYDALKVQIALGGEVPAVDGSQFYRLHISEGGPEDYSERTIGYYSTKEAAYTALAGLIFLDSEGTYEPTPWGLINDFDDPALWNNVRLQWFQSATLQEMINWYTSFEHKGEAFEFYLTKQSVSPRPPLPFAPKGLMEAKLGA